MASGDFRDFAIIHDSARAAVTGANPYDLAPGDDNLNPPHVILLTLPLGWLSITSAAIVMWSLIALSIAALTVRVARVVSADVAIAATVIALAAGPIMTSVRLINFGWPLALGVTLAWVWLREGRYTRSGLLIGFLAASKLFLFILVAHLAWRKQWRALLWATVGSIATLSIGVLWFGIEATSTWLTVQSTHLDDLGHLPMNMSLLGALKRGFAPTPETPYSALIDWPGLVVPVWIALSAGLAGVFWWRYRRSTDLDAEWAWLLMAALLISPLGWGYYLPMALGPLTAVLSRRSMTPALGLGIAGIVASYPDLAVIGQPSALASLTVGSAATWSLLLIMGLTLARMNRPERVRGAAMSLASYAT